MNNYKFLEMRVDELGRKKMTQEELANVLHIERNRIQSLETSPKVIPKDEELKAYCKYFNTTSDYLLGINPAKPKDENIIMISSATGLSDKSINKLKEYTHLQRNIVDVLISSQAIDKIIEAYRYRNSEFFQTIEIIDNICGKRTADKEESKSFHLFHSVELLKEALEILSNNYELFMELNHNHTDEASERMWKIAVDMEIESKGIKSTIEHLNRDKKVVPNFVFDYINKLQQK